MSTHIHFMITEENFPKISLNICFLELSEEFPRFSETNLSQPGYTRPSVVRSLKFYSIYR